MELVLPPCAISVPSVLVQSDSDPRFRTILTHSFVLQIKHHSRASIYNKAYIEHEHNLERLN